MKQPENPFAELLVVELASVLAGPSVGQFFAELGATVLKVENLCTNGDVTRTWKTRNEDKTTDISAYFSCANWGKQSVALNLAEEGARQAFYKIAARADVVIASYKPGDAEKLQVDYQTLAKLNPRLVYGHITGYGSTVKRAGYDAIVQAESGFMHLNGEPEGQPTKMPVALMDVLTAHQLKEGILAALYLREKTGQGRLVEVSLMDSALASLVNQATNYLVAGHNPQRMGSEHPNIVPYGNLYTAADGKQLVLAVGDDRQFRLLCEVLDLPGLALDERFCTNACRVEHRQALQDLLVPAIARFTREVLLEKLRERHVPAGAVHDVAEVMELPATQEMLMHGITGSGATLPGLRSVAFRGVTESAALTAPPHFGQHTLQVLHAFAGTGAAETEELLKNSAIFQK